MAQVCHQGLRRQTSDNRQQGAQARRFAGYLRVAEREVIKAIWVAGEQPFGKRLKAALEVWLPHYEKRRGFGS